MAEVQELKVRISAEDQLSEKMKKAQKELEKFATKAKKTGADLTELGNKSSKASDLFKGFVDGLGLGVIEAGLTAAAIAKITQALVEFGKACLDANKQARQLNNLMDFTFGSQAAEMNDFAKALGSVYGMSNADAKGYLTQFAQLGESMGMAKDDAKDLAKSLTKLGAEFESLGQGSDALNAFEMAIRGNYKALAKLGITLSDAKQEAIAMSMGITAASSEWTEITKAAIAYEAIMQGAVGVSDIAAQQAGSWAQVTSQLAVAWNDFMATLGELAELVLAPIVAGLVKVIEVVSAVTKVVVQAVKIIKNAIETFLNIVSFGLYDVGKKWLFGSNTEKVAVDTAKISNNLATAARNSQAMAGGTGATSKNLNNASKAAATLKRTLLGFDEMNVLQDNGSIGALGGLGDLADMLSGLGGGISLGGLDFSQIEEDTKEIGPLFESVKKAFDEGKKKLEESGKDINDFKIPWWEQVKNAFVDGYEYIRDGLLGGDPLGFTQRFFKDIFSADGIFNFKAYTKSFEQFKTWLYDVDDTLKNSLLYVWNKLTGKASDIQKSSIIDMITNNKIFNLTDLFGFNNKLHEALKNISKNVSDFFNKNTKEFKQGRDDFWKPITSLFDNATKGLATQFETFRKINLNWDDIFQFAKDMGVTTSTFTQGVSYNNLFDEFSRIFQAAPDALKEAYSQLGIDNSTEFAGLLSQLKVDGLALESLFGEDAGKFINIFKETGVALEEIEGNHYIKSLQSLTDYGNDAATEQSKISAREQAELEKAEDRKREKKLSYQDKEKQDKNLFWYWLETAQKGKDTAELKAQQDQADKIVSIDYTMYKDLIAHGMDEGTAWALAMSSGYSAGAAGITATATEMSNSIAAIGTQALNGFIGTINKMITSINQATGSRLSTISSLSGFAVDVGDKLKRIWNAGSNAANSIFGDDFWGGVFSRPLTATVDSNSIGHSVSTGSQNKYISTGTASFFTQW